MIRESDYYIGGIFREGLYIQDKNAEKRNSIRKEDNKKDFLIFDDDADEVPII